jgi:hypothetical protein
MGLRREPGKVPEDQEMAIKMYRLYILMYEENDLENAS